MDYSMIKARDGILVISEKELIEMAKPLRGLYRHQTGGWRVKIMVKGEMLIDELFSDRQYGGPLYSFTAALATRDAWFDHLGLKERKTSAPRKRMPPWSRNMRPLEVETEDESRELESEEMPGISLCVHEGEEGYKTALGKKEAFFSIKKWGEVGAKQFAELQLERWQEKR